ncbi:sulfate permease [Chromohalobacter sp. 48-RD10]|uniref:SulP family inorganic anion transporter n=1 Tax=Chromohalobacter sp. 48-RD10 TaxID=2994063 RepID=UPI002468F6C0|nr:sulfate permease [Chromohalobacter sp. 48-RD10]
MKYVSRWCAWLPILSWIRDYDRHALAGDGVAAVIVTLMLIPQALAYAMLAGLPPVVGLYASLAPLLIYTLLGTSTMLSVGPMAVVALMTASALEGVATPGSGEYLSAALTLAVLSGAILIVMGIARLGFLVNFLSHPVMTGFVSASGVLIAASQLKHLTGADIDGATLPTLLASVPDAVGKLSMPTLTIGATALGVLLVLRHWGRGGLQRMGMSPGVAGLMVKLVPIFVIVSGSLAVMGLGWNAGAVSVIGEIPVGMPPLTLPSWAPGQWQTLLGSALLISIVGYVESVSVGQALAVRRGERLDPNQELVALGSANLAAGCTGGMPVTGGFSRSVINFDAGARTPAAGAFTALGVLVAMMALSPWLHDLPMAVLSATIVVAVLSLVDLEAFVRVWRYSHSEGVAMLVTAAVTLGAGVEWGISTGVGVSLALHLYRTSRPHSAEVGRIPSTEHFRNVHRHAVETDTRVVILRIDESLYFANVRYLEDLVTEVVGRASPPQDLVLACQAVNIIDATALESLETLNRRLVERGIRMHLAEVKGPVMDRLRTTALCSELSGQIFLSLNDAWVALHGRMPAPLSSPSRHVPHDQAS